MCNESLKQTKMFKKHWLHKFNLIKYKFHWKYYFVDQILINKIDENEMFHTSVRFFNFEFDEFEKI